MAIGDVSKPVLSVAGQPIFGVLGDKGPEAVLGGGIVTELGQGLGIVVESLRIFVVELGSYGAAAGIGARG